MMLRSMLVAALLLAFCVCADAKCTLVQDFGCLAEGSTTRVLQGFSAPGDDSTPMSYDFCGQICADHQFKFAGVEYGHQCFCGNVLHYSSPPNSTGCGMPCTAASSEDCGGPGALHAYSFSCQGPPTPPPPPTPSKQANLCPDYGRDYCQPSVPLDDRIAMVMAHMSPVDKMQTMAESSVQGKWTDGSPLISRSVSWWNEALHGLRVPCGSDGKCSTQFAEANAMSSSFNTSLWSSTATAISDEARGYYSVGILQGLTFFAPQINMASNPLWGRNMECPGEDPHLSASFAYHYVHAFQGGDAAGKPGTPLKAVATPKHFTGQTFEGDSSDPWRNGTTVNRQDNDTRYTLRDLEQYYLPSFRAALVDAEAGSLMCAYQSINGVPSCANGFMLNRLVRQTWGWKGFVVSDCDAIKTMMVKGEAGGNPSFGHAYSMDGPQAVRDGVRAGCDSNCGDPYRQFGDESFATGLLEERELDASVRRLLRPMFQLGLFDPPETNPWNQTWADVATPAHKQLALDGARQSVVLLQNAPRGTTAFEAKATAKAATAAAAATLPLAKGKHLLLVGPEWNATFDLLGNYNGHACPDGTGDCLPSLSQWVKHLNSEGGGGTLDTMQGVPSGCDVNESGIAAAVAAADNVDTVVLALGGNCHEGEGTDRDFLHLPGSQVALVKAILATGKPVAAIVLQGGPYALDELKASPASVLVSGFPGQAGAQALAEALFGDINPSGKLTTTIYPDSFACGEPMSGAPWMDSGLRPDEQYPGFPGRTHMFYSGPLLWPFGFGMSYTSFELAWGSGSGQRQGSSYGHGVSTSSSSSSSSSRKDIRILASSASTANNASIPLDSVETALRELSWTVRVTNTGSRAGKEVVQAYWTPPDTVDPVLKRQLFDFEGVYLEPGASADLVLRPPQGGRGPGLAGKAAARELATVTEGGDRVFLPGLYKVSLTTGNGQDSTQLLTAWVDVVGTGAVMVSTFPSPWVEGHEVAVDACVEGTSDVIPHLEPFVTQYKIWDVFTSEAFPFAIVHRASSRCLSLNKTTGFTTLRTCDAKDSAQQWRLNGSSSTGGQLVNEKYCLSTAATNTTGLRRNVMASVDDCSAAGTSAQWLIEAGSGLIRSAVPFVGGPGSSRRAGGLCLAARHEGIFNEAS